MRVCVYKFTAQKRAFALWRTQKSVPQNEVLFRLSTHKKTDGWGEKKNIISSRVYHADSESFGGGMRDLI